MSSLEALSLPFRQNYLTYQEVTTQLTAWAKAFPEVVRLQSLGKSLEGRDLWLLTIGNEPDRKRPTVWIDGNMHASELCGTSVALALAEDAIRLQLDPSWAPSVFPKAIAEKLRDVRFFVLPMMCPDGADAVLQDGRYVRSNPRNRRLGQSQPYWRSQDIDGDGLSLLMRIEDPAGDFVASHEVEGLMLPRRLEDEGPFYKIYQEAVVENFDGYTLPDPYFLSDNDTDLNRNFPYFWKPEPTQAGAGSYAASEPETRAVADFVSAHPEIFAWLNLHTFGGVYIRPLGTSADNKMDASDLALYRQIGVWCEEFGGYPMVSGFEEFLYEPEKPLYGDIVDFAYHQRGSIAYVCELWDLFAQLGFSRKKPFVDNYTHLSRENLIAIGKWDVAHNQSRVIRPWKRCEHPQLGEVEVGGVDPRIGMVNPPYEKIAEVCEKQRNAFFRVAALSPMIGFGRIELHTLGEGLVRVEGTVENLGYLPSYVLSSAKELPWNDEVSVAFATDGCMIVSSSETQQRLGHLEGWGSGLYANDGALFHQRSRGNINTRKFSVLLRGEGTLMLRASSSRMGMIETSIHIGETTK